MLKWLLQPLIQFGPIHGLFQDRQFLPQPLQYLEQIYRAMLIQEQRVSPLLLTVLIQP